MFICKIEKGIYVFCVELLDWREMIKLSFATRSLALSVIKGIR